MKKILLLTLTLILSLSSYAQDTCATALPVGPGTYTVAAIDGTEVPVLLCDGDGQGAVPVADGPAGEWYLYTATTDGVATISTDLAINVDPFSVDTRVHIYSGSCAALVCEGGDDDISTTNYLSTTTIAIVAGDSYYVAFDNRWSALGFNFEITETPIPCLNVGGFVVSDSSETGGTLSWTPNDDEALWNIEYGDVGFVQGFGTMVSGHNSTSFSISGQPAGSSFDFYVQADCGVSDGVSIWNGPFALRTLNTPVGCGVSVPSNAIENGSSCTADDAAGARFVINDITVPENMDMTVAKIIPNVFMASFISATAVDVVFYEDNGGVPGAIVSTQNDIVPTSTTLLGTNFGFDVSAIELDLTPVVLTGESSTPVTYWIGISVSTSDASNCFWENSSATSIGLGQGYDDGLGTGIVVDSTLEGVYSFEATCEQATASINENELTSLVKVYPTAVDNQFTIENNSTIALIDAVIFDVNGRLVGNHNLNDLVGSTSIDVSNLNAGLYFVELNSNSSKLVKKIVKK